MGHPPSNHLEKVTTKNGTRKLTTKKTGVPTKKSNHLEKLTTKKCTKKGYHKKKPEALAR